MTAENLLSDWYRRIRFAQFAHYEAAKSYDRMNYGLGIPVVVLSTFVGTSVFANIGSTVDATFQILIGLVSVVAATLASLQTFFRFSEKAEKHRAAASKYGALRREIEEIMVLRSQADLKDAIPSLRSKVDRLSEEAPHIPHRIWARRKTVLKEDQENFIGLLDTTESQRFS
ncbi:MAG: DUF4231 domain-containing protein [Leptolyngbyaceae cyanobacterium SM2_5_2]|nr:DUF4231 domain-containing protein [Leptolyngbyaceae cyanobacterium SM2_5_2]